jgi:predicted enzyme related to lactoylglutathione lyase
MSPLPINRLLINICADYLPASKSFYTRLFDFTVDFDSDWFVHLISKDKRLELGIIDRTNDIVPKEVQNHPQGFNPEGIKYLSKSHRM